MRVRAEFSEDLCFDSDLVVFTFTIKDPINRDFVILQVYNPRNTESVELHFRGEKTAKVRSF